jgi:hypothetical protein
MKGSHLEERPEDKKTDVKYTQAYITRAELTAVNLQVSIQDSSKLSV